MLKERAEYTTIPIAAVTIWRATIIFQATVTKKMFEISTFPRRSFSRERWVCMLMFLEISTSYKKKAEWNDRETYLKFRPQTKDGTK